MTLQDTLLMIIFMTNIPVQQLDVLDFVITVHLFAGSDKHKLYQDSTSLALLLLRRRQVCSQSAICR